MTEAENCKRLYALAEKDMIYTTWKQSYDGFADRFYTYANKQDEAVRNFLCGYAESGWLMMQRIVNIACKEMEFKA